MPYLGPTAWPICNQCTYYYTFTSILGISVPTIQFQSTLKYCFQTECPMQQVRLRPKFTRQTNFDQDEIWPKNQPHYEEAMVQIWDRSSLKLNFPFFCCFGIFSEVRLSSVYRKAHDCDSHIFIFLSMYFEPISRPGAMRKALMLDGKRYVYSYYMRFGSECSLGGSGR